MTDPLGFLSRQNPAQGGAFRPLGPGAGLAGSSTTPGGGIPPDPSAPSFKDALMDNLREANRLQQEATRAVEDLAAGKRTDVETVLVATQKADTAFRMLLALRNKVQTAYDEIKQIRV